MAKKIAVFFAFLLVSCNPAPPKVYECSPGKTRKCVCLDGQVGYQECSRGAMHINYTPRTWIPCSCCWTILEDEHGPYFIKKNEDSGCWLDSYDPATPTYDVQGADIEGRRFSDGETEQPRDNNQNN